MVFLQPQILALHRDPRRAHTILVILLVYTVLQEIIQNDTVMCVTNVRCEGNFGYDMSS